MSDDTGGQRVRVSIADVRIGDVLFHYPAPPPNWFDEHMVVISDPVAESDHGFDRFSIGIRQGVEATTLSAGRESELYKLAKPSGNTEIFTAIVHAPNANSVRGYDLHIKQGRAVLARYLMTDCIERIRHQPYKAGDDKFISYDSKDGNAIAFSHPLGLIVVIDRNPEAAALRYVKLVAEGGGK